MIGISALLCAGAGARQPAPAADLTVPVRLVWEVSAPPSYDRRAKFSASRLLAEAGITLEWRKGAPHAALGPDVIGINVVASAPPEFANHTLASALPYAAGPVRIQVYFDRLVDYAASCAARGPEIMGYVLAHEIGHVLEGVARHSTTGLMRANWTADDLYRIQRQDLSFAPEDRRLMRSGLEARQKAMWGGL